jgi:phage antirepressor YoqD-like protein
MDTVSQIMAYENGEMEQPEMIAFFQFLLDSGMIYSLQGSYQRTAQQLIEAGLIEQPKHRS